ncbi:SDR family NAD(P)-dependent oxidoreductase [Amycolatopsis sp. GM8]|uniref:SDR family NAD(P)-dependent oxidoreductase n=1 Tax=Amycolatopsis sp. GM8 TaxID=2896530 RepID=UPI001F3805CD|nr:SDR family NAD(P)-dependent oxidoreductase [Amycolatopsis sp. GM8]
MEPLKGRVAVVTGGSRGVGRAVALVLGAAGATVYLTGRSRRGGSSILPGTIDDTRDEIVADGGQAIAVECDHSSDESTRALFARVEAEQGRLDLLVNSALGSRFDRTPELYGDGGFWTQPLDVWDDYHDVGVRSYYVASALAVPLLLRSDRAAIVNLGSAAADGYILGTAYGVSKAAVSRLSADMAHELRAHGVASIEVRPGMQITERAIMHEHDFAPDWKDRAQSPRLTGLAVRQIYAEEDLGARSGQVMKVAEVVRRYGLS